MWRYARWVVRRPKTIAGVIAAISLVLGSGLTRLHVEVDPDKQLPQEHPYIQALNEVYRTFGDKNLIVIGLFPHDGKVFTPAFLRKLDEITRDVGSIEGANPSLLQSLAASHAKSIVGTRDDVIVERVMDGPPETQAGADEVRRRAFANSAYVGTLVSRAGDAAAIQASFDLGPRYPDHKSLLRAVTEVLRADDDGTFTYRLSGPVTLFGQLAIYSSRMAYLFPLALLVIALVHYDAFRTFQGLVLPIVTALLSVLWSLGLMGLLGVSLDPLNATTAILILAIAAGHAVQVLKRFYEEFDRTQVVEEAVAASLVRVGPVMLAAGTVAALSFFSLASFGTAAIRTFGVFTGLGVVSALVLEMTLIPALRMLLPAPRRRERQREAAAHPVIDALVRRAFTVATVHRGRLLAAVALLVGVCVVAAFHLRIDTSVKREFRAADLVRVDDDVLNANFAGTNTLIALVKGAEDNALERIEIVRAIAGLQHELEGDPSVGKTHSYVDVLRDMHAAFSADETSGRDALPGSSDLVAQYLYLHSMSGGTGDLDSILDPSHRIAKVRVLVHDDSTRHGEQLIAKARRFIAANFPRGYEVDFTGTLASSAATTEVMVRGKIHNIAQIAAVSVAVSTLLLGSLWGGLLVVLPLALTVIVNFGVMGMLGIPLDMVTGAISAMAVGIGADYAIYLLFRIREEAADRSDLVGAVHRALFTSGKAIVFVSTAVAAGYLTLCLSGFGVHVQLGGLVALAMVVSASSALLLLPAVLLAAQPRFVRLGSSATRDAALVFEPAATPSARMPAEERPAAP